MDMGQYPVTGLTTEQLARQETSAWEVQRMDADQEAEGNDESDGADQESDAPEPPELHDAGDSSAHFDDKALSDPFDFERSTGLPRFEDLPYPARPYVSCWIDCDFEVHDLDRRDNLQTKRRHAIAKAVALHLKESNCPLVNPGDWCQIPCIGDDSGLLKLVEAADPEEWKLDLSHVPALLKKLAMIKDFAIMLPNRDVVAVQALIDRARKTKNATRAAALRVAAGKPHELAGEDWKDKDWNALNSSESSAKSRAKGGVQNRNKKKK